MPAKRIIPCLDITGGRVVKGVRFVELRDAGDPVSVARAYEAQGADELTFLDITASSDGRDTMVDVVRAVARQVFMPLTVGGGIRAPGDVRRMLQAGADKVSLNTAAILNPDLIDEASRQFGAQCIVLAIDARRNPDGRPGWTVYTHGGRKQWMCVFVYEVDNVTEPANSRTPMTFREVYLAQVEPDDFRRNERGELGTRTSTLDRDGVAKLRRSWLYMDR